MSFHRGRRFSEFYVDKHGAVFAQRDGRGEKNPKKLRCIVIFCDLFSYSSDLHAAPEMSASELGANSAAWLDT